MPQPTLSINGADPIPITLGSLSIACQSDLGGATLSARIDSDSVPPGTEDLVELSVGGLTFKGRCRSVESDPKPMVADWSVNVTGFQEFLQRELKIEDAGDAAGLLSGALTGTPVGYQVGGDGGSAAVKSDTTVANAVTAIAESGNFGVTFRPDGILVLFNRSGDLTPTAEIAWNAEGVRKLKVKKERQSVFSRVVLKGNPSREPSDAPFEDREQSWKGDGENVWFELTEDVGLVKKVFEDGDRKRLVLAGDPDEGDADYLFFASEKPPKLKAINPPADGVLVKVEFRIFRILGVYDDTARQTTYAGRFGGDGVLTKFVTREDLTDSDAADDAAAALAGRLNNEAKSASAELYDRPVYLPGTVIRVVDDRVGFDEILVVESGTYTWDVGHGTWFQSLQLSNGFAAGGGEFFRKGLRPLARPARTPDATKHLSPNFTISVTGSHSIIPNSTDAVEYTVTVTPLYGFTGPVSLSMLAGVVPDNTIPVFDDDILDIVDENPVGTTLTLTPNVTRNYFDGTYSPAHVPHFAEDTREQWALDAGEYPFTVRGESGALQHDADGTFEVLQGTISLSSVPTGDIEVDPESNTPIGIAVTAVAMNWRGKFWAQISGGPRVVAGENLFGDAFPTINISMLFDFTAPGTISQNWTIGPDPEPTWAGGVGGGGTSGMAQGSTWVEGNLPTLEFDPAGVGVNVNLSVGGGGG